MRRESFFYGKWKIIDLYEMLMELLPFPSSMLYPKAPKSHRSTRGDEGPYNKK
jgi:hypothetical protein